MMNKRLLLCFSYGLLLLSACSTPSKTSTTLTPDPLASDPSFTAEATNSSAPIDVSKNTRFVYASGTSPSDETVIQNAITDADQYFGEQGYSAGTVTISLVFDKNKSITLG